MKYTNNSAYLEAVTIQIENLQKNPNSYKNDEYLDIIKKNLNREFNQLHCVAILVSDKPTKKSQIFGARTYPTQNEIDKINKVVVDLIDNKKYTLKEYLIEIDYALLYNKDINATPDEILAVLLHEIGHIIHYDKIIEDIRKKLFRAYRDVTIGTVATVTTIAGIIPLPLYIVGLVVIYNCESFIEKREYVKNEILADSLAIEYGKGTELKSILTKIFDYIDGPTLKNNSLYKFIVASTREGRAIELDKAVQNEILNTNSKVIKTFFSEFLVQSKKNRFMNNNMRNLESKNFEIYQESMNAFFEILKKGYSDLEIEELYVEIQRMTTYEDKACIVARIGRDRQKAEVALTKIDPNNKSTINKIKNYLEELNKMSIMLRKTNPERQYGVLVKAPIGYEG